jgi:hypothetical protein
LLDVILPDVRGPVVAEAAPRFIQNRPFSLRRATRRRSSVARANCRPTSTSSRNRTPRNSCWSEYARRSIEGPGNRNGPTDLGSRPRESRRKCRAGPSDPGGAVRSAATEGTSGRVVIPRCALPWTRHQWTPVPAVSAPRLRAPSPGISGD